MIFNVLPAKRIYCSISSGLKRESPFTQLKRRLGVNMLDSEQSQAQQGKGTGKTRIMIVNDDLAYLELMQDFLEGYNFEVTILREPDVTLGRIRVFRPDLLIIDLIFGKEPNGWLILQQMRADADMQHVPILMCSAAVEQMRERSGEYTDEKIAFLEKPFDLSVMMTRILDLLKA